MCINCNHVAYNSANYRELNNKKIHGKYLNNILIDENCLRVPHI